jgi:hypothetical protein
MDDDDIWVDELAGEIEAYLGRHPAAAESREGIFEGWILRERFLRGLRALDRAIDRLVREGRLEEVRTPDGGVVYRAPRSGPGGPP